LNAVADALAELRPGLLAANKKRRVVGQPGQILPAVRLLKTSCNDFEFLLNW